MSNKITITDNTTKVVTIAAQGPKGDKGAFSPDENQTINFSGSKYSGSMLISMTTTGSIIPEGNGNWDIGSEKNPFRDLYITTESLKFVSKGTGRVVSSLSTQNVEDLKVGKTINPTIKTLRKTDGTTETKTRFIEAQAFVSSLDNDVYIKTGTDRIDFVAGGTGGSQISLKQLTGSFLVGNVEYMSAVKDTDDPVTNVTLGGPNCSSTLIIKSRTEINCALTASGILSTDPIYAPAFIETGTGTPTITSDSNLVLSASNAVVVASSPFRLKSFVNSQTASGQITFVAGDMYFNSNTNKFMGFNGTSHVELG